MSRTGLDVSSSRELWQIEEEEEEVEVVVKEEEVKEEVREEEGKIIAYNDAHGRSRSRSSCSIRRSR